MAKLTLKQMAEAIARHAHEYQLKPNDLLQFKRFVESSALQDMGLPASARAGWADIYRRYTARGYSRLWSEVGKVWEDVRPTIQLPDPRPIDPVPIQRACVFQWKYPIDLSLVLTYLFVDSDRDTALKRLHTFLHSADLPCRISDSTVLSPTTVDVLCNTDDINELQWKLRQYIVVQEMFIRPAFEFGKPFAAFPETLYAVTPRF